jgi:hypothetical protein
MLSATDFYVSSICYNLKELNRHNYTFINQRKTLVFSNSYLNIINLYLNNVRETRLSNKRSRGVKAGIVWNPEDYQYCSAIDYSSGTGFIGIDYI